MGWYEAESLCDSLGGTLPIIKSSSKNAEILSLIQDDSVRRGLWLGLSDENDEGEWTWVDGTRCAVLS